VISANLIDSIKIGEGFSATAYRCPTGRLTIGYGRCVDPDEPGTGITESEAEMLLANDLERFEVAAQRVVGEETWSLLDQVRREALIEMAFNMGAGNLAKFRRMLSSLSAEDYSAAADEALSSRWADQVGKRADRIADRIRSGVYAA
tara:strand:- start:66 stop:506 length:441 start_codon:yes stop_codon:yes gene_type:complete